MVFDRLKEIKSKSSDIEAMKGVKHKTIEGFEIENCMKKLNYKFYLQGMIITTATGRRKFFVHSDICGAMRVESNVKAKSYITIADDCFKWAEIQNKCLFCLQGFCTNLRRERESNVIKPTTEEKL